MKLNEIEIYCAFGAVVVFCPRTVALFLFWQNFNFSKCWLDF